MHLINAQNMEQNKRFLIVKSLYSINEHLNYQHKINIDDCCVRKEL